MGRRGGNKGGGGRKGRSKPAKIAGPGRGGPKGNTGRTGRTVSPGIIGPSARKGPTISPARVGPTVNRAPVHRSHRHHHHSHTPVRTLSPANGSGEENKQLFDITHRVRRTRGMDEFGCFECCVFLFSCCKGGVDRDLAKKQAEYAQMRTPPVVIVDKPQAQPYQEPSFEQNPYQLLNPYQLSGQQNSYQPPNQQTSYSQIIMQVGHSSVSQQPTWAVPTPQHTSEEQQKIDTECKQVSITPIKYKDGVHLYTQKECTMCSQELSEDRIIKEIKCGHLFHIECLRECFEFNIQDLIASNCPKCGMPISAYENSMFA